jgi:hypothetical protein
MAKLDDIAEQVGACSAGVVALSQRFDALELRLKNVERHAANPQAHRAAHEELRELLSQYGLHLPERRDAFGFMHPDDVKALFSQIRATPGAQLPDGSCPAHERTIERLATLFRHFGWAA